MKKAAQTTTKVHRITFHQPIKYKNKTNHLLPYELVHELKSDTAEMEYLGGGDYLLDKNVLVHSSNVKAAYLTNEKG